MSPLFSSALISSISAAILFSQPLQAAENQIDKAQMRKGQLLYLQNCAICHQSNGQGAAGTFPPLAQSDFLLKNKERSIRAVVEGLSGPITVNGKEYSGFMAPVVLDDEGVANVLTFVRNSWGNEGGPVTAEEVKKVRAKTQFPTFEDLAKANAFAPLPKPPEGFTIREFVRMPNHPVRLASDGKGNTLYSLGGNGDIWRIDPKSGAIKQILWGSRYVDASKGDASTVGFTLDSQKRFYIVVNQRNESVTPVRAEITIFRTTAMENGEPAKPEAWFETSYPWGIGPFNHGVGHIAIGPDGKVYVNSGSRTDGNEPGKDSRYSKEGETPITACIWRLDPKAEKPELEIHARGLRNAYGFCWNDQGEMFATDNGPDADAPEELNKIEHGKHYGFPYTFADWKKKAYPYTPEPPPGVEFTLPVANLGPDGGFDGKPCYTFDPHSSPSGIVYLGKDFPAEYQDSFLVTRFGILVDQPRDSGFDLLQVRVKKIGSGHLEASVNTLLAPLARPVDVHLSGKGKIYICEYTRAIDRKGSLALPGRILELAVKK